MTNSPAQRQAAPRFDTIDLLRGFSILSVVLLHVSIFLGGAHHPVGESLPRWLRYVVFNNGGNGVSAFFAISGFLITYISIRRFGSLSRVRVAAFYRIRFARIAPPLALLLCVLSVLHLAAIPYFHIKPSVSTLPRALLAAITFHLNWFEAVHGWLPANWTVLWTLSVEEMFYVFFPLLCLAFARNRRTYPVLLAILIGLVLFGPFARTPWYTTSDIWGYQSYLGNVDNIALGCLFAIATARLSRNKRFTASAWPLILQIAGSAFVLFIAFWIWPHTIFGWHVKHDLGLTGTDVTVIGLGTCLVMLGSVLRPRNGSLWTAPLRWLGRYSYEVYLTHPFAQYLLLSAYVRLHRGPICLWVCGVVLAAGILGFLLARIVSEPANRVLRGAPLPAQLAALPQQDQSLSKLTQN